MLVTMCVGLWAILSVGAFLRAPEYLVGTWDLVHAESPRSDTSFTGPMIVEQSGIYANLHFKSGETLQMKLRDQPTFSSKDAPNFTRLDNDEWTLEISGLRDASERQMFLGSLTGPQQHEWTARRRTIGETAPTTPEPVVMAPADGFSAGPSPATQPLTDDARP